MDPVAGSPLADRNDGSICINNLGDRWRQKVGGDTNFDKSAGTKECAWDNRSCKVEDEK